MLNLKPQVNISHPTAGRMWLVFCCASLAVIQSALGDEGLSLIVALTALCSGILAEILITFTKYGFNKVKDGSAAASAMVLSLLLPNHIHPVYAALGTVFAIVVIKHSFGGLGSNWMNPALGGWLVIHFSWPQVFFSALEGSPLSFIARSFTGGVPKTGLPPLELIRTSGAGIIAENGSAFDSAIRAFLNDTIFSIFRAELPAGYMDMLCSNAPGIIADRGLLALIFGTIVITAFQTIRSWIPALYLVVFGTLVWIAGDLPFGGRWLNGDVLFALFSGGTLAAAFILVPEPASGSKSRIGIFVATILGAVLSWMFRYQGLQFYGCFFAVAMVNSLVPIIRSLEGRWFYSRKRAAAPVPPGGNA
jgi:electron transport complex protein RnfD